MRKRVLGLDIGSNSIGFSLLDIDENRGGIVFNEITSNSIVFSDPNSAKDRREARSSRRMNERKSNLSWDLCEITENTTLKKLIAKKMLILPI